MGCIRTFCSSWSTIYWMLRRIRRAAVRKSKFRSEIAIQTIPFALYTQFLLQSVQKAVGIYQKVYLFWLRAAVDERLHWGSHFPIDCEALNTKGLDCHSSSPQPSCPESFTAVSSVLWEGGQPATVHNPQFRPRKSQEGPGLDLRQMGNHSLIQPRQILPHARHVLGTNEPQTEMWVLVGLTS